MFLNEKEFGATRISGKYGEKQSQNILYSAKYEKESNHDNSNNNLTALKSENSDFSSFRSFSSQLSSSISSSFSNKTAITQMSKKRNLDTATKGVSFAESFSSSSSSSSFPSLKQVNNSLTEASHSLITTSSSSCSFPTSHSSSISFSSSSSSFSSSSSSSSSSMYVVPNMACEVENILNEMGVQKYEERVVHMLVDILQRETLTILNSAGELAALRIESVRENLNLSKRNICMQMNNNEVEDDRLIIQREDSELAVNEYINKYVLYPSALEDNMRLAASTNILGSTLQKEENMDENFSSCSSNFPILVFPPSLGPYLPEDVNINTILPGWDLKVLDDMDERREKNNSDGFSRLADSDARNEQNFYDNYNCSNLKKENLNKCNYDTEGENYLVNTLDNSVAYGDSKNKVNNDVIRSACKLRRDTSEKSSNSNNECDISLSNNRKKSKSLYYSSVEDSSFP